jgi:hypothetical protein
VSELPGASSTTALERRPAGWYGFCLSLDGMRR